MAHPRSGYLSMVSAFNGIGKCWFLLSEKSRKSREKSTEEEGRPTKKTKLLMTSSIRFKSRQQWHDSFSIHPGEGPPSPKQSLIRGGSALGSNPLPFYIPFWQKRCPFYIPDYGSWYLLLKQKVPLSHTYSRKSCSHFHVVLNKKTDLFEQEKALLNT